MIGNRNYISKVPPISQKVSQSDHLWAGCPDKRGLTQSVESSKGATYLEVSFHYHLCDLQPVTILTHHTLDLICGGKASLNLHFPLTFLIRYHTQTQPNCNQMKRSGKS